LICVTIGSLALACAPGNPTTAVYTGGNSRETMAVGTWDRSFTIHLPTRATPGPVAQLIVAYHGLGQTAAQLEAQTDLDATADAMGAIVVYPEAALGQWDVTGDFVDIFGIDDLAFTRQMLDRLSTEVVYDQSHVTAVGLSNGAEYVQRLACEMADRFTGFVTVAGTLARPARDACQPSRPVAALYIIGSNDTQFPVGGDDVVLSVDSTMDFWAGRNHCGKRGARAILPDTAHDSTVVYRSWYLDCAGGAGVGLDSIAGSGHGWPGEPHAGPGISRNLSVNVEIRRFVLGGGGRPR
jgi:polyhydroxybutyrate depolymerase